MVRTNSNSDFCPVSAYGLTKPNAGSDAAALRMKAVYSGDGYILNGAKAFISGGDRSKIQQYETSTLTEMPVSVAVEADSDLSASRFWHARPPAAQKSAFSDHLCLPKRADLICVHAEHLREYAFGARSQRRAE
jgi:hypothetical protein